MQGPIFAVPPGEPEFVPAGGGELEAIPTTIMPQTNLNSNFGTNLETGGGIQQMNYEPDQKRISSLKKLAKKRRFPYWKRD